MSRKHTHDPRSGASSDAAPLHADAAPHATTDAWHAALVESLDDALVGTDLQGVIRSWNAGAERMFGWSREEMLGESVERLVPAERVDEERAVRTRLNRGERVEHFDTERLTRAGSTRHVSVAASPILDAAGRLVGSAVVANDISQRKLSEALLAESAKEVKNLKAALDEHAIVAITDPAGRITYVNEKFCSISGYSREELLGQDHRIVNSSHHPKTFIRELWDTIRDGRVWRGEIRNRAKDGSHYWVDTTIVPFLDEAGRPAQYVAIRADITERKRAEEELQRRTDDLVRSNKDLQQFAYAASHDLREPLRAVAGCVQLLQKRYGEQLDPRAVELIEHAVDGTLRMQTLIDALLAFSRVGTRGGRFERVDSDAALDEVLANLEYAVRESGARITRDALPVLVADATQFLLLFQNLVGNALKFRRPSTPPQIHVGARRERDHWVLSVRDNGIGIEPRYADYVFGLFQRLHTRREYEGSGMGLAICRRIMEGHGGSITLESEPGQGSTFECRFPHDLPVVAAAPADARGPGGAS